MQARKRKKTKGAYYIMSTDKDNISRHDDNFIGKVGSMIYRIVVRVADARIMRLNVTVWDSGS